MPKALDTAEDVVELLKAAAARVQRSCTDPDADWNQFCAVVTERGETTFMRLEDATTESIPEPSPMHAKLDSLSQSILTLRPKLIGFLSNNWAIQAPRKVKTQEELETWRNSGPDSLADAAGRVEMLVVEGVSRSKHVMWQAIILRDVKNAPMLGAWHEMRGLWSRHREFAEHIFRVIDLRNQRALRPSRPIRRDELAGFPVQRLQSLRGRVDDRQESWTRLANTNIARPSARAL